MCGGKSRLDSHSVFAYETGQAEAVIERFEKLFSKKEEFLSDVVWVLLRFLGGFHQNFKPK